MNKDARPRASTSSTALSSETIANRNQTTVAKTDVQALPGCRCDCQDTLSEASFNEQCFVQCQCTACGPGDGHGNRRCLVAVNPVVMMATALAQGLTEMREAQPCYCGDCREFCVLQLRKAAVERARTKRKHVDSPRFQLPSKFKPTWAVSGEVVRNTVGEPVEIEFVEHDTVRQVLQELSTLIGICQCRLVLISDQGEVRPGLMMRRWAEQVLQGKLTLHRKYDSFKDKELMYLYRDDGVCLKCLKEAGFRAKDFIINGIQITAVDFKEAGYTLEDLLKCFPEDRHPLRIHPPSTAFTLFDNQLKDVGYDAKDFKNVGYSASELSENACYYCEAPEGLTRGELDWIELGAFFTASELASAGYLSLIHI